MKETLFPEIVDKWFSLIAKDIQDKINEKKEEPKYLFQQMLSETYSPTLKWDSISTMRSVVAADVVSMDSPLPLKKRDAISKAGGEIPKLGMKMQKGERLITDINILRATGAKETIIAQRIFEDLPKVISGVYERIEYMFLQGLSTGIVLVPDSQNVGSAIRVSYNYLDKNKFGVSKRWGSPDAKPLADIENVLSKASEDGNTITTIVIGKKLYNLFRTCDEAKELYAQSIGFAGTNIATPMPSQFNSVMADNFGVKFVVVDRAVKYEKDGKQTAVRPFDENSVVFLTSDVVGSVYYGTLAEEASPVQQCTYQKVGNYILTKKFSYTDPLQEFTASEALAVPVIEDVDSIYLLNNHDTVNVGEGVPSGMITVFGEVLPKEDVVAALKSLGASVSNAMGEAKIIAAIGKLSAEQKNKLKELLGIE
jgi:hypothetical protein